MRARRDEYQQRRAQASLLVGVPELNQLGACHRDRRGYLRRHAQHENLGVVVQGPADSLAQPDREGGLDVHDARAVAGSARGKQASEPWGEQLLQRCPKIVGAYLAQSGGHAPAPELASMMYRGVMV